ncbi:hypothetical protein Acsp02_73510 [Actinoplanes sp. NBRC 103695]|nr:hypothetical protein Acsp02_73510 [Actinoplanes sp. NBRC 103695]
MNATFWLVAILLIQGAEAPRGSVMGTATGGGPNCGTRASSERVNATDPAGRDTDADGEGGGTSGGTSSGALPGAGPGRAAAVSGRTVGEAPQPATSASNTNVADHGAFRRN